MGKMTQGALLLLGAQIAMLLLIPEPLPQSSQPKPTPASARRPPELLNVRKVELLPEGLLRITYVESMGLRTFHHFINVKSGNMILIEDENIRPEQVLLSQTRQGGLEITVSHTWNLDLSQFEHPTDSDSLLLPAN